MFQLEILPTTTKAILVNSYENNGTLVLGEKKLKQPTHDEVIVQMAASPINPSDLSYITGKGPSPSIAILATVTCDTWL